MRSDGKWTPPEVAPIDIEAMRATLDEFKARWNTMVADLRPVMERIQRYFVQIGKAFRPLTHQAMVAQARRAITPDDPEVWGDAWQSPACAGWLHTSCRRPEATECQCRCHPWGWLR